VVLISSAPLGERLAHFAGSVIEDRGPLLAVRCPPREPTKAALGAAWGRAFGPWPAVVTSCERVVDDSVPQSQDGVLPDSRQRRRCRVAVPSAVQLHDGCSCGRGLRGAVDVRKLKRNAKARAACAAVDLGKASAPPVDVKPSIMSTPTAREGRQCRRLSSRLCRTDERPRGSDYDEPENPATHCDAVSPMRGGRASSRATAGRESRFCCPRRPNLLGAMDACATV
jgi:hypothetical protein